MYFQPTTLSFKLTILNASSSRGNLTPTSCSIPPMRPPFLSDGRAEAIERLVDNALFSVTGEEARQTITAIMRLFNLPSNALVDLASISDRIRSDAENPLQNRLAMKWCFIMPQAASQISPNLPLPDEPAIIVNSETCTIRCLFAFNDNNNSGKCVYLPIQYHWKSKGLKLWDKDEVNGSDQALLNTSMLLAMMSQEHDTQSPFAMTLSSLSHRAETYPLECTWYWALDQLSRMPIEDLLSA